MKRLIEIAVLQQDGDVELKLRIDGKIVLSEDFHFCDTEHATGYMADLFNFVTGNRYSNPSKFPKLETKDLLELK